MAKTKRNTSISRKTKRDVKKSKTWSFDSVFEISTGVFSRLRGRESVLVMNVDDEKNYFEITGVAGRIFQAIDGKRSIKSIVKKYDPEQTSEFKTHVTKLIRKLLSEKLIQIVK